MINWDHWLQRTYCVYKYFRAYEQISHQIEKIDVKIINESILFLENNFRKFNSQS